MKTAFVYLAGLASLAFAAPTKQIVSANFFTDYDGARDISLIIGEGKVNVTYCFLDSTSRYSWLSSAAPLNYLNSTSLRPTSKYWYGHQKYTEGLKGPVFSEVVQFGKVSSRMDFAIVNSTKHDCVIGIGPSTETGSFANSFYFNGLSPSTEFALDPYTSFMLLGGTSLADYNLTADWIKADTKSGLWKTKDVVVGYAEKEPTDFTKYKAVIDYLTPEIIVPEAVADKFYKKINGTKHDAGDRYVYNWPCDKVSFDSKTDPPQHYTFKLFFGTTGYKSSIYIPALFNVNSSVGSDHCQGLVVAGKKSHYAQDTIVIGRAPFQFYLQTFDARNSRFAFTLLEFEVPEWQRF